LADDKDWRRFPQFEKIFDSGQMDATLQKIEKTCKQLDVVMKTGSPEEKARAQAAMTAYGRTLELFKELAELREAAKKK
jgi:hypothetical protein